MALDQDLLLEAPIVGVVCKLRHLLGLQDLRVGRRSPEVDIRLAGMGNLLAVAGDIDPAGPDPKREQLLAIIHLS